MKAVDAGCAKGHALHSGTVQRILLIQLKRLGDFILTAPAVEALRAVARHAELVLVVPAAVADLARCITSADRVIPYQSGRMNSETWVSALAGEWDACLDFTGSDRSALLTKLSRARQRTGYAKHARGLRRFAYTSLCQASVRELHTADFHLALVRELFPDAALQPESVTCRIPADVEAGVRRMLAAGGIGGRYAVVHPGTAREEKFWLDEGWAEVCRHLHESMGLQVVLTGSGDGLEAAHLARLRELLRVPVADLTGRLNLVELAAVVRSSEVVLGVDSMAMHLAATLGRPQVALFGPTNPFHWRPRHERVRVLLAGRDLPPAAFSPKEPKREMKLISTPAVIDATRGLLTPS